MNMSFHLMLTMSVKLTRFLCQKLREHFYSVKFLKCIPMIPEDRVVSFWVMEKKGILSILFVVGLYQISAYYYNLYPIVTKMG